MSENLDYKSNDHEFRKLDPYANAKYEITTDWLTPALKRGPRTAANIGCGSGEYNESLAALGLDVVATEPERGAFEVARQRSLTLPNVNVKPLGLQDLAADQAPVDLLVMHDVLEHIEDEADAVACITKLIKPGGEAVISVPAYNWLFGYHDVQLGHYRRYTKSRLIKIFSPDFEILEGRYYGSLFIPVTLLISRILKRGYPTEAVTGGGWKLRVLQFACRMMKAMPEPIGTSVLVHLRRKLH